MKGKPNNSIMIVGLGELGGKVLELLARVPNIPKIITTDVNEDWGERKTNTAVMGASYLDLYPDIQFKKIDLFDIEGTAKLIAEINPGIIYNATTLQSWWVIDKLPRDVHDDLYKDFCGLGPWISLHLLLVYKLSLAKQEAKVDSFVINSSFPDNVNPALGKLGLAPVSGIGNIDLAIPPWRKVVSELLEVPLRSVQVFTIGHHYNSYNLARTGTGLDAPYYIKIMVDDQDVTGEFDIKELAKEIPLRAKRTPGTNINWVVASSAVRTILGILFDTKQLTHVPGPEGLPGGYPVRLSKEGVRVFLPEGVSREQAIRINKEAQRWDGIEEIKEDGTIVFTDIAYNTFKELLGYECKELRIAELEERAKELDKCYKDFARKYGVDV